MATAMNGVARAGGKDSDKAIRQTADDRGKHAQSVTTILPFSDKNQSEY